MRFMAETFQRQMQAKLAAGSLTTFRCPRLVSGDTRGDRKVAVILCPTINSGLVLMPHLASPPSSHAGLAPVARGKPESLPWLGVRRDVRRDGESTL